MYCASCGTPVTPGLSYCKRCGEELSAKEFGGNKRSQVAILESLVWAIVAMAVLGIGAPIGLMAVMKEVLHLDSGLILGTAILSFLPFLAAEIVFIWLLLRPRKDGGDIARTKGATTRELEGAQPRAFPEPASSITEHTTHTLDHVRRTGNSE